MAVLFVVAFLMRLVPVLNGAGPLSIGQYDDGVHYAAALALVNGQLPYRDFLFLQPPGIVIALIPFAALGAATHDSLGFIVARLAWMLLGAVNAVLVARLLRRTGTLAAVAGGVFYAVYYPAIHVERSIMLEGLTNACLIVALLVLPSEGRSDRPWRSVVAGALLGVSTGIKIWGLVIALVVIIWAVVARRYRDAGLIAVGTAAGATAVCGPFFLAAPAAMWRMVVRDQIMRPANGGDPLHRLPAIAAVPGTALQPAMVICLAFLFLTALSLRISSLRVAPALVIALGAMLMVTPSYFSHYAAVLAVPLAIVVGAACHVFADLLARAARRARVAVGLVGLVAGFGPGRHGRADADEPGGQGIPLATARRVGGGAARLRHRRRTGGAHPAGRVQPQRRARLPRGHRSRRQLLRPHAWAGYPPNPQPGLPRLCPALHVIGLGIARGQVPRWNRTVQANAEVDPVVAASGLGCRL